MKISAHYSHFNGLEWLEHHHAGLWKEIQDVIAGVDAVSCKIKKSKEQKTPGKIVYSPPAMNKRFAKGFLGKKWKTAGRTDFCVTDDAALNRKLLTMSFEDQKAYLAKNNLPIITSYNVADFRKKRVSVEVQFGKYAFVQYDMFNKHAADYMHDRIDLGIEIVPSKKLQEEMSSGPSYFEKNLHEIARQGRIFPPVPLILIGVEP
jgi:hypothetical protein